MQLQIIARATLKTSTLTKKAVLSLCCCKKNEACLHKTCGNLCAVYCYFCYITDCFCETDTPICFICFALCDSQPPVFIHRMMHWARRIEQEIDRVFQHITGAQQLKGVSVCFSHSSQCWINSIRSAPSREVSAQIDCNSIKLKIRS